MTWNKFWLWYDISLVELLLLSAKFTATSDGWVLIDGWLAIANAVCAVIQWKRVEEESSHD